MYFNNVNGKYWAIDGPKLSGPPRIELPRNNFVVLVK
jgi:hypothetical protein